jgi:two-component system NtrC family sensor kinase
VLYRKVVFTAVAGALVLALVLLVLLAMAWRSVLRLEPVDRHLAISASLQEIYYGLSEDLAAAPDVRKDFVASVQGDIRILRQLQERSPTLQEKTAARLGEAARLLEPVAAAARSGHLDEPAAARLREALVPLRQALRDQLEAQRDLYAKLQSDGSRQLQAALALAVLLLLAAIASLVFFQHRVLTPLDDLSYLMGLLARKDYTLALTEQVDPPLRPLFEKYNRMVKRMRGVEEAHVKREGALQREVDSATGALIQQQAALARADRLAAIGELSARVAHELRNPISGVMMALTNLAEETADEDARERLNLAVEELERVARLLSKLVEDGKPAPERPHRLQLTGLVDGLFALLRYQLPRHLVLEREMPQELECVLPEAGLRQTLINLVLNAAQAMGETPGRIRVSARREGGELVLCVCDDGPGFRPEILASGGQGLAGVGLASLRRFVTAQAGRLEIFNRDVGGACVLMFLPQETAYG